MAKKYCPQCGREVEEYDKFCFRCGAELQPSVTIEEEVTPPTPSYPPPAYPRPVTSRWPVSQSILIYAGFWKRFLAWIIDSLILFVPLSIINIVLLWTWPWMILYPWDPMYWVYWIITTGTSYFVVWFYFSAFESSGYQGTPGKMACNIIVTDIDGRRISFARAFARNLSKMFSDITLLIGYLLIALTERKQGLHDMIAGTLVVNR
ncbi:MAG: RDD family protein [Promethearchaeota archaeon]